MGSRRECKGCPGTFCKVCHETGHKTSERVGHPTPSCRQEKNVPTLVWRLLVLRFLLRLLLRLVGGHTFEDDSGFGAEPLVMRVLDDFPYMNVIAGEVQ